MREGFTIMGGKILVHTSGDLIMVMAESGNARAYRAQPDGSLVELEEDALWLALREGARFASARD
jgi:hypothetical protein